MDSVPTLVHTKVVGPNAQEATAGNSVRFYRTAIGREPALDWLRTLDKEDRRIIGIDLMRVQFGWPNGMPLVRSLKDGLRKSYPSLQVNESRAATLLPSGDPQSASRVHQEIPKDGSRRPGLGNPQNE